MPFDNLPGIFQETLDGNLSVVPVNDNPILLVLGTAAQGPSETVYEVQRVSDAARTFGNTGNLTRGLYEVSQGGALNIRLYRIGATAAKLEDIGSSPGLTVETLSKDNTAGNDYSLFYDDSTLRLRVYRVSDGELVFDNNPAYPLERVDLNEVSVYGSTTGGDGDIGTLATPLSLKDAGAITSAVFTEGTDGLSLSRMETWEALYDAYKLLEDQEADVIVPMNVYLDDKNVMDIEDTERTNLSLDSLSDYPDGSDDDDVLGKVFVQEYQGLNYYWWWFPSDIDADVDSTFTSDSGANIFPSAGSANATTDAEGNALTGSDFHEVNFAYQLANFCYTQTRDQDSKTGVIGVLPPVSFAPRDVANWVGKLPTTDEDANGNVIVASGGNGTGLLGNKFMSGRTTTGGGLPGYTVNGIEGLFNGGFPATSGGFLDQAELTDDNDHLIDIGKYLSIVATLPILSNPSNPTSYSATGAPTYAGFYSALPAVSAPSNKILRSIRLPFRVGLAKLDDLAGQRYVTFHAKRRGIVISDSPTAARPDSDYQRLSTVRQVKAAVDTIRRAGEPFLGEGMTGALIAALDTAIDSRLKSLVKAGLIRSYRHKVVATPQQRVLGQATVELRLVPAFELRQITVVVALAAV